MLRKKRELTVGKHYTVRQSKYTLFSFLFWSGGVFFSVIVSEEFGLIYFYLMQPELDSELLGFSMCNVMLALFNLSIICTNSCLERISLTH